MFHLSNPLDCFLIHRTSTFRVLTSNMFHFVCVFGPACHEVVPQAISSTLRQYVSLLTVVKYEVHVPLHNVDVRSSGTFDSIIIEFIKMYSIRVESYWLLVIKIHLFPVAVIGTDIFMPSTVISDWFMYSSNVTIVYSKLILSLAIVVTVFSFWIDFPHSSENKVTPSANRKSSSLGFLECSCEQFRWNRVPLSDVSPDLQLLSLFL